MYQASVLAHVSTFRQSERIHPRESIRKAQILRFRGCQYYFISVNRIAERSSVRLAGSNPPAPFPTFTFGGVGRIKKRRLTTPSSEYLYLPGILSDDSLGWFSRIDEWYSRVQARMLGTSDYIWFNLTISDLLRPASLHCSPSLKCMPSCIYLWLEGGSEIRYTHGLRPWLTQSDHAHTEQSCLHRAMNSERSETLGAHTELLACTELRRSHRALRYYRVKALTQSWGAHIEMRCSHRALSIHGAEALTQNFALIQIWCAHTEMRCSHRAEVFT